MENTMKAQQKSLSIASIQRNGVVPTRARNLGRNLSRLVVNSREPTRTTFAVDPPGTGGDSFAEQVMEMPKL